jgi:hypothetical protein
MCHVSSLPVNVRDTMKIDWRRSIGRHGPGGVFPSDLQEDLADGGIVSLPESYHAATAQRRHAPSCGIIVRYQSKLWTGSMRCGVVRTRQYACYIPSHHKLVTWATYTVSKCWLRKLTLWLSKAGPAIHWKRALSNPTAACP